MVRRDFGDSLPCISLGVGLFTPYLYFFDESIISVRHRVLSEPRGSMRCLYVFWLRTTTQ